MANYVKYIECPICEDGYYINIDGDYTHVDVRQQVCKQCESLIPEPAEDPTLSVVGP